MCWGAATKPTPCHHPLHTRPPTPLSNSVIPVGSEYSPRGSRAGRDLNHNASHFYLTEIFSSPHVIPPSTLPQILPLLSPPPPTHSLFLLLFLCSLSLFTSTLSKSFLLPILSLSLLFFFFSLSLCSYSSLPPYIFESLPPLLSLPPFLFTSLSSFFPVGFSPSHTHMHTRTPFLPCLVSCVNSLRFPSYGLCTSFVQHLTSCGFGSSHSLTHCHTFVFHFFMFYSSTTSPLPH